MAPDVAAAGRPNNLRESAGPMPAPAMCPDGALLRPISDDLDLWDAWSLLGDVGTALSER